MKFLENLFFKTLKPHFEKGGKLEPFYYAFEAGESFHFVTDRRTEAGSHVRDHIDLKRMMVTVVLALVPCLLFGIYNTGVLQLQAAGNATPAMGDILLQGALKVLPLMLVVYAAGGIVEAIFSCVRKHEINEGFLVSGMLITLVLPATLPLWQAAVGTIFGVFIGKEVFGGTGMNILNPALTARAFLFFAYPAQMSGDKVWVAPNESLLLNGTNGIDGIVTQATPLASAYAGNALPSTADLFFGFIPGSIGETSALACLLGAAVLIISGIGSWRTMLGTLLGGAAITALFKYGVNYENKLAILDVSIIDQLCMGGFAFGLVFMCTDPVSSAATNKGKWIFGFLTGILAMTIRCLNPAYPEGMMLAILFMNVFAPLVDHYVVKANIKRRLARA